jgi:uncharacterized protein YbjT (DUF2867 family)
MPMKLLLFGATGMVGQGVLRQCLLDPNVEAIVTVGRTATGAHHPKLHEIVRQDLWNYADIAPDLSGFQACFFCLGVSSAGMAERDYERITYGITLAAAQTLCRLNPQMVFVYVSGAGTDSSEHGRSMWTRVKGRTENALLLIAVRGGVHVSSRNHRAYVRREIEDGGPSGVLHADQTAAAVASRGLSG